MKLMKRSISIALLLVLLSISAIQAAASPNPIDLVETDKKTSLTLQYVYNSIQIEGATFNLYRVGDMTKAGSFRFNSPFHAMYDSRDDWATVAGKMEQRAKLAEDPVTPYRTEITDENGVVAFTNLPTGVYLVSGEPREFENEDKYSSIPFLVSLPTFVGENHDGAQNVWKYDVVAVPKVNYTGNKYFVYYWDNSASINNTPVTDMPVHEEIFQRTSERLRYLPDPWTPYVKGGSGENEKNSFSLLYAEPKAEGYTFQGWNINPEATEGYSTIAYDPDTRRYDVYAIWKLDETQEDPPESQTTASETTASETIPSETIPSETIPSEVVPSEVVPSGTVPSQTENSTPVASTDPDNGGSTKKDPILPQTGMLWWPVPVLAILGLAVFISGVVYNKMTSGRKNKGSKSGIIMLAGILLVSSAVCLTLYNGWDNMRAGSDTANERAQVVRLIPDKPDRTDMDEELQAENIIEMPVKRIDGTDFDAMLSIPSLSLELPVRDKWSYPGLRRSPCRYTGSAYTDDLVICGHNYTAHFGNLKKLKAGDDVTLTAMNGDVFSYKVREVTELAPTAISEMTDSAYDLTLFTCTIGGGKRVTVRCELVNVKTHSPDLILSEYVLF